MNAYFSSIYQRIRKTKRRTRLFGVALITGLLWFWLCLPDPLFHSPTSYVIEDAQGELLGAGIAADGQWRFPYNENVPEKFRQCIISFEDKRFNHHPGIDPLAILRAIRQNIRSSGIVSGGSTITMQVIRLSRNKNRNILQKLIEGILAVRLEIALSKNDILALYASNAPFGSNVVGLDAAAWRYYGRSADKLGWGEMATLAVLPNAPSLVHPGKNRQALLTKRNRLLDRLKKQGKIDSTSCELAKLEPLPDEPQPLPQLAPHLLQRFKKESAAGDYTRVKTTINRNLQNTVSQIVEQHHRFLKGNGINNACALVLEVETGKTLAYVGNVYHPENPELQSHVDIITSARSPGSALKPLLYAGMLTDGLLLPRTLVPDIPTQIGGYTPQNFDRDYDGAVPAFLALSRSLNVPAVRMLRNYKYPRFYDLLKKTGITTLNRPADHYGLSLILGGCEVTPWDLAGVYAGMARALNHSKRNNGKVLAKDFHAPYYLSAVSPSNDQSTAKSNNQPTFNFIDPISVWYMFQAMEEVMRPGEEGLWKQFSSSQRVAWKTGTSFGFRDAWAIGVTPRYVIAVWAGNANGEGRPGLIGVQAAAPVMFDIVRALPSAPWFAEPASQYATVAICRQSGFRANTNCIDMDTIKAPLNGTNVMLCPYHTIVHLNMTQQYRVTENCAAPSSMVHKSWFVLPPVIEWYYKRKHLDYQSLPAYLPGCAAPGTHKPMDIIYPEPNAKIYVPREITGEKGRTVFTATHQKENAKIFWHLDDAYIGTTVHFHQMALDPRPGKHFLTIVDEAGERITRQFEILEKDNP
ncbi:penicillin-binding protein 1C [Agriterribacter sp.]|uniref:penicillin-binding protein 1C n=1 Tax=Agriterribacter sp. TaxID=2821509 RepID=UPI002C434114|nr:penicillin-binding protein 1C [Agriterribacter sp.]HRP55423.1 penicillin-binding protein 1C [Agriterribacter sp.]